jgi:ABC-2 type transport system ATP-binding protein
MIEVRNLSKCYRGKPAVDGLTFTVAPGKVTGFLGPNGAGKSTTMRLIVGLDRPDRGTATVLGRPYRTLRQPLRSVGAMLEARTAHGGSSAYHHLLWIAQTQGLPATRVAEVLEMVGLRAVARARIRGFSLGMGQRLAIAAALIGDPPVLLLDEPVNGLDPDGVRWIRELLKNLAGQGRTVFVSSHLMNEMAVTADHLIVISRGRLLADGPMAEFIANHTRPTVLVRTADPAHLIRLVTRDGGHAAAQDGAVLVTGLPSARVAEVAAREGLVLSELTTRTATLEEAFLAVTS